MWLAFAVLVFGAGACGRAHFGLDDTRALLNLAVSVHGRLLGILLTVR
jgi:hypothetical protein